MSTFGIVHRSRGGTRAQYDNLLKVVHPDSGKSLPKGQLLHLAGPTGDECLVMAVHESRESWERFRDNTWMAGLASVADGMARGARRDDVRRGSRSRPDSGPPDLMPPPD